MSYRLKKSFLVLPLRPGWLDVLDLGPLVSEVADEAAEIRVLLVGAPELLDDLAVVEAESREVVDELDVRREPADEPVVELPRARHAARIRGCPASRR